MFKREIFSLTKKKFVWFPDKVIKSLIYDKSLVKLIK